MSMWDGFSKRKCCANCEWFQDKYDAYDHSGLCKRMPPVTSRLDRDGQPEFAMTVKSAICGEWKSNGGTEGFDQP